MGVSCYWRPRLGGREALITWGNLKQAFLHPGRTQVNLQLSAHRAMDACCLEKEHKGPGLSLYHLILGRTTGEADYLW